MEYHDIIVEKKGRIETITLNRPQKANAFSGELLYELVDALEKVAKDEEVDVVMLKGNGKHFSAGIDFEWISNTTQAESDKFDSTLLQLPKLFQSMDKITIAVIHGGTLALGYHVPSLCDFIIASEDARLGAPFINSGAVCTWINATFPQIGPKKVMELSLLGKTIDGKEAERLGVVNRAVPAERIDEVAMEMAEELLTKNPTALFQGKRVVYAQIALDKQFQKQLELGTAAAARLWHDGSVLEGMRAFVEKRKPDYKKYRKSMKAFLEKMEPIYEKYRQP